MEARPECPDLFKEGAGSSINVSHVFHIDVQASAFTRDTEHSPQGVLQGATSAISRSSRATTVTSAPRTSSASKIERPSPRLPPVAMTGRPFRVSSLSGTLILLCSFVAIDHFLGLDTRLVVGMKASIERHTVKGVLLHEDHALRQVISLNNSVVDFPQHLALRVDVGAFWDVHHENRSNWFGAKLPVLAHTVRPPFTQKDPYVVWIRVGLM